MPRTGARWRSCERSKALVEQTRRARCSRRLRCWRLARLGPAMQCQTGLRGRERLRAVVAEAHPAVWNPAVAVLREMRARTAVPPRRRSAWLAIKWATAISRSRMVWLSPQPIRAEARSLPETHLRQLPWHSSHRSHPSHSKALPAQAPEQEKSSPLAVPKKVPLPRAPPLHPVQWQLLPVPRRAMFAHPRHRRSAIAVGFQNILHRSQHRFQNHLAWEFREWRMRWGAAIE